MAGTTVSKQFEMGKTEIETIVSFAESLGEALPHGLDQASITVIANPYEALNKDKDALLDRPFMIRAVKFLTDEQTGQEYLNMWVVRDDDRLFRVTDGSTGIYAQMDSLVAKRINENHPTPYNFFLVPNGLRKSEFGIDEDHNTVKLGDPSMVSKAATYYLA